MKRKSPPDALQVWRAASGRSGDQAADADRQTGIWRVRRERKKLVKVGCMLGAEYNKNIAESRALGKLAGLLPSLGDTDPHGQAPQERTP